MSHFGTKHVPKWDSGPRILKDVAQSPRPRIRRLRSRDGPRRTLTPALNGRSLSGQECRRMFGAHEISV